MSIVRCEDCEKFIDTDYDTEHFIDGTEHCNICWNCNEPCSQFSEYQDDGRTFCSLECINKGVELV
jgi:hypothetical protein